MKTQTIKWPTNKDHARKLARLIRSYDTPGDAVENLIDILADARHLCDLKGYVFSDLDRQAHQHYATEVVVRKRKVKS